ncbi:hypothetical protein RQP46_008233 [Phenoliferia psychrophenolica]
MAITTDPALKAIYSPLKGKIIGAVLVSSLISCFLFGIVVVNAVTYYSNFQQRDTASIKGVVGLVCILALLNVAPDSWMERSFYAWRIWSVTAKRNWWVPTGIVTCSIAQFSVTTWATVTTRRMTTILEFNNDLPTEEAADHFQLEQAIIVRSVELNVVALVGQFTIIFLIANDAVTGLWFLLLDKVLCNIYPLSVISSLTARGAASTDSSSYKHSTQGSGFRMNVSRDVVISEERFQNLGWRAGNHPVSANDPVTIELKGLDGEKTSPQPANAV